MRPVLRCLFGPPPFNVHFTLPFLISFLPRACPSADEKKDPETRCDLGLCPRRQLLVFKTRKVTLFPLFLAADRWQRLGQRSPGDGDATLSSMPFRQWLAAVAATRRRTRRAKARARARAKARARTRARTRTRIRTRSVMVGVSAHIWVGARACVRVCACLRFYVLGRGAARRPGASPRHPTPFLFDHTPPVLIAVVFSLLPDTVRLQGAPKGRQRQPDQGLSQAGEGQAQEDSEEQGPSHACARLFCVRVGGLAGWWKIGTNATLRSRPPPLWVTQVSALHAPSTFVLNASHSPPPISLLWHPGARDPQCPVVRPVQLWLWQRKCRDFHPVRVVCFSRCCFTCWDTNRWRNPPPSFPPFFLFCF